MSIATIDQPALARRDPAGARSSRRAAALVIAVPSAVAAVLALYQLDVRSLWLDEAASVAIASQHGHALWHAIAHDGGNMLGYYLVLHVVIALFGHGEVAIRLPSVIGAVATVALTTQLARRLFDDRIAFAAGLLTAVSLPLVFWGQDARGYALMIALIVASFWPFAELVDGGPSRWPWVAYVVCIVLATYMSFVAALVVPAQLVVLGLRGRRDRAVIVAAAGAVGVAAICCVPIMVLAARRGSAQLFWVPAPSFTTITDMLRWLTSAGMPPNFHRTAIGTPLLILSLLLAGGGVAAAVRAGWRSAMVAAWLLVPVILIVAESIASHPVDLARTAIVSLPAASILTAWALLHPRAPARLGAAVIGIVLVLRLLVLAPSYGSSPENWKAAVGRVLAGVRPGDCAVFYPADGWMAFNYYAPGGDHAPAAILPAARWGPMRAYVEDYSSTLPRGSASCTRTWLIASHQGFPNGPSTSRANYAGFVSLRGRLERAYPLHRITEYGWADPVRVELLSR